MLLCLGALSARADSISFFPDDPPNPDFDDLRDVLNTRGLHDPTFESDGQSFIVPDAIGDGSPVSVTSSLIRDSGDFQFTFGTFPVAAVAGMDASADRFAWTEAALTHPQTMVVFDDRTIDPCADMANPDPLCQTTSSGIQVGSEWFFFLIPNNTLDAFTDDPHAFYYRSASFCAEDYGAKCRKPLFSYTPANPSGFDQMLSFTGNGQTLFSFEDLSREGWSDEDFTDLVFVLDFEGSDETFSANESQQVRTAAPAPASLLLMLVGIVSLAWFRCARLPRRRKRCRRAS